MKIRHNCKYDGKSLKLENKEAFMEALSGVINRPLSITVEYRIVVRSNKLNNYYWHILVPALRDGFYNVGYDIDLQSTHEYIKRNFNYIEVFDPEKGKYIRHSKSTSRLSNKEFILMFQRVQIFAAEFLGKYIPDPNEQLHMELQQ